MKIEQLMELVNAEYTDDLIKRAFEFEEVDDGLATFIATELQETFVPDDSDRGQLMEAEGVMRRAKRQLEEVCDGLREALDEDAYGPKIDRIHSVDCIKKADKDARNHFFDRETMRFFNSRALGGLYKIPAENKILFVSSEKRDYETPREYRVRVFDVKTSRVMNSKRMTFATPRQAKRAAKEMEENNSTGIDKA